MLKSLVLGIFMLSVCPAAGQFDEFGPPPLEATTPEQQRLMDLKPPDRVNAYLELAAKALVKHDYRDFRREIFEVSALYDLIDLACKMPPRTLLWEYAASLGHTANVRALSGDLESAVLLWRAACFIYARPSPNRSSIYSDSGWLEDRIGKRELQRIYSKEGSIALPAADELRWQNFADSWLLFSQPVPLWSTSERKSIELCTDMDQLLQKRWPPERIVEFCRPETRMTGLNRVGKLLDSPPESVAGKLYLSMHEKIGDVSWNKNNAGDRQPSHRPGDYSLTVKKGSDQWLVEYGELTRPSWNDDDYIMHRLYCTLLNSLDAYRKTHTGDCPICIVSDADRKNPIIDRSLKLLRAGEQSLERNNSGKIVAYGVSLSGGSKLKVTLDKNANVENISIDGKPDEVWNDAYKHVNENIEKPCAAPTQEPETELPKFKLRDL